MSLKFSFAGAVLLMTLVSFTRPPQTAKSKVKRLHRNMLVRRQKRHRLEISMASAARRHGMNKTTHLGSLTSGFPHNPNSLTDEQRSTINFERQRGRLPWPVTSRTIAVPYGLQEYMPGIHHPNTGITIGAGIGDEVRSVADGEVLAVFSELSAVMIRHGLYYTTYSNLFSISVSKGDQIKAGELIGQVGSDGRLDFLISDGESTMYDPAKWLTRPY